MSVDERGLCKKGYQNYTLWHMKRLCSSMTIEQLNSVKEHVEADRYFLGKEVENQEVLDYLNKQIELKEQNAE